MISIRQSTAEKANEKLKDMKGDPNETNSAWLKRVGATLDAQAREPDEALPGQEELL